jgi:hypothetical protein
MDCEPGYSYYSVGDAVDPSEFPEMTVRVE